MADRETRSHMVTVRLSEREYVDLEELAQAMEITKSDALVEGMRMVRDLRRVIVRLSSEDPELANVLQDFVLPGGVFSANLRRKVADKVLMGLIREDVIGAGRRARLALKLLRK